MSARTRTNSRPGMALVELLLALVITSMVGLGVASMLSMVSGATAADQDRRSVLLRALAAQVRIRAYISPSLCVLQHDPEQGMAVWLKDDRPDGNVHLSELRVLWFDGGAGEARVERVAFPDEWPQALKDSTDVALALNADYFAAMLDMRKLGYTRTETLVDGVAWIEATFNEKEVDDASRVSFSIGLNPGSASAVQSGAPDLAPREVLMSFGLSEHEKPSR